jgi:uncharacterized protein
MYRRRLVFLLAIGLAHGVLLYYGDILAFYAICGFLLSALYAGRRPAALARGARRWWIAFVVVTLGVNLAFEAVRLAVPGDGDPSRIPDDVLERLATYTSTGYADQLALRATDYAHVLSSLAIAAVPLVMGLFVLGALAGRQGWFEHPQRHRRVWRAATWIGICALPFAAGGAWINFDTMANQPGDPTTVGYTLMSFGMPVAALYVALVMRWRDTRPMRAAIAWLAPAGRMPLTNYLLQSLIMGLLLAGWGLGWGARLSHAQLAALALPIVALQIVASRAWMQRFAQGPVEWLWRRATYGRA